jgi:hypothetical protein
MSVVINTMVSPTFFSPNTLGVIGQLVTYGTSAQYGLSNGTDPSTMLVTEAGIPLVTEDGFTYITT